MPCDKVSRSSSITMLYSEKLFFVSPRQIPSKDSNWHSGVKITQAAEERLRVCWLASYENPNNC
jgi:hypothetical protein